MNNICELKDSVNIKCHKNDKRFQKLSSLQDNLLQIIYQSHRRKNFMYIFVLKKKNKVFIILYAFFVIKMGSVKIRVYVFQTTLILSSAKLFSTIIFLTRGPQIYYNPHEGDKQCQGGGIVATIIVERNVLPTVLLE